MVAAGKRSERPPATMQQELHPFAKQSGQRAHAQRTSEKKAPVRLLFSGHCRLADSAAFASDVDQRSSSSSSDAFIGSPARPSTRSRNSLPGLKCGTNFSGTSTFSPDLGLRPTRDGRRLSPKL